MRTGLRSASDLEGLTWSGSCCGNIADGVVVLDAVLPHMCLLFAGPAIVVSARSRDCRDDEAAKLHCCAGPKKISCRATVSAATGLRAEERKGDQQKSRISVEATEGAMRSCARREQAFHAT